MIHKRIVRLKFNKWYKHFQPLQVNRIKFWTHATANSWEVSYMNQCEGSNKIMLPSMLDWLQWCWVWWGQRNFNLRRNVHWSACTHFKRSMSIINKGALWNSAQQESSMHQLTHFSLNNLYIFFIRSYAMKYPYHYTINYGSTKRKDKWKTHLLFNFSTASEASKRVSLARSCTVYNSWPPLARTITQAFCLVRTQTSRSGSCWEACLSDLPFSKSMSARTMLSVPNDSYKSNPTMYSTSGSNSSCHDRMYYKESTSSLSIYGNTIISVKYLGECSNFAWRGCFRNFTAAIAVKITIPRNMRWVHPCPFFW